MSLHQHSDRGPWQQTVNGHAFFPGDPRPADLHLDDIALSLAKQCRFNGHCEGFYSVAQHAVVVSELIEEENRRTRDPLTVSMWREVLWGLHHDDGEISTGDIPSQIKQLVPEIKAIEHPIELAIAQRFCLTYPAPQIVKWADRKALAMEKRDVMGRRAAGNREQWAKDLPAPADWRIIPWEGSFEMMAEKYRNRHFDILKQIHLATQ